MSVAVGHVTRKDGKIVEFPDQVLKLLKWLTGVALLTPVIMLMVGLGDAQSTAPLWLGVLLSILPIGLIVMGLISTLRSGMKGNVAFGFTITFLTYLALTLTPLTNDPIEMMLCRGVPIIGIIVALYYLRADLRFNLRPLWYSMKAMKEMQEMMMKQKMAKEARKRGESIDPEKVIDAEAIVRAMAAKTGKEVPAHMAGINTKPGFRQESKAKSNKGGGGKGKQRKKKR